MRTDNGKLEEKQTKVVEMLGDHFSTVATNIGGDHINSLREDDYENHSSIKAIQNFYDANQFAFQHVNQSEVRNALRNTNPKKLCGWNPGAPPKLLKRVAQAIAPSLPFLHNNCTKRLENG